MARQKIKCGARRKYDGQPCEAKALDNGRCKYHGGMSTGPRTLHGKIRALSSLHQYAACRREMRAVADALEKGHKPADAFVRLTRVHSPYVEGAAKKIASWMITPVGD